MKDDLYRKHYDKLNWEAYTATLRDMRAAVQKKEVEAFKAQLKQQISSDWKAAERAKIIAEVKAEIRKKEKVAREQYLKYSFYGYSSSSSLGSELAKRGWVVGKAKLYRSRQRDLCDPKGKLSVDGKFRIVGLEKQWWREAIRDIGDESSRQIYVWAAIWAMCWDPRLPYHVFVS